MCLFTRAVAGQPVPSTWQRIVQPCALSFTRPSVIRRNVRTWIHHCGSFRAFFDGSVQCLPVSRRPDAQCCMEDSLVLKINMIPDSRCIECPWCAVQLQTGLPNVEIKAESESWHGTACLYFLFEFDLPFVATYNHIKSRVSICLHNKKNLHITSYISKPWLYRTYGTTFVNYISAPKCTMYLPTI